MLDTSLFLNPDGVAAAVRNALAMFQPPPDIKPSEWAEKNVRIPTGNAIPGPFRIANAPYQREPMDMRVNLDCYRVSLMWGAQVGKTLTALCLQGYAIDMRPQSQMMMQPSQGDAQTWLETKFNPLVEASPGIAKRIAKPRGREGVNNQRMKSYPGGFLMMAWSGSPKTMRGRSAPLIVCDEVDGYARTPEGHPVSLLWQRSATFGDERFLFEISTPTIEGASYIHTAYLDGDQRKFHVACPHCQMHQVMRWENVTWIGRRSTCLADAMQDANHEDHQPHSAMYACVGCGGMWNDGERIAAIRTAEMVGAGWKAAKPFKGHASYHLWEAYSTMRKLGDIVRDYLDKIKTDDLQTFANVSLSEVYAEAGDKADPTGLQARAYEFPAQIPAGGLYLTAGIDMQQDRLEIEVVAWGEGEQSWSVDYRVLWGDPLLGDVWDDLDDILASGYMHESGRLLPISAACLDTGGTSGYTQRAYEYLKGKTGRKLFGIKGVGGWGRPIVEKPQRKQSGKNARKIDLFLVGTDEAKLIVMRRLAVDEPGVGYCNFPAERDAEWYKQITAEKLLTHYVKGQPVREWSKPDKARNEALDCRVYALAALKIMQPSFKRIAAKLKMPAAPAPPSHTIAETAADAGVERLEVLAPLPESVAEIRLEAPPTPAAQTAPVFRSRRVLQAKPRGGNFATKW